MFVIQIQLNWNICQPICRSPSSHGVQVTSKSEIETGSILKTFLYFLLMFFVENIALIFSIYLI